MSVSYRRLRRPSLFDSPRSVCVSIVESGGVTRTTMLPPSMSSPPHMSHTSGCLTLISPSPCRVQDERERNWMKREISLLKQVRHPNVTEYAAVAPCACRALRAVMLCCAVLCCAELCCAVLCCAVLRCAVLCDAVGRTLTRCGAGLLAFPRTTRTTC